MATRSSTSRKSADQPTARSRARARAVPAETAPQPVTEAPATEPTDATAEPAPRRRTAKPRASATAVSSTEPLVADAAPRTPVDDDSPRKAPKRSARQAAVTPEPAPIAQPPAAAEPVTAKRRRSAAKVVKAPEAPPEAAAVAAPEAAAASERRTSNRKSASSRSRASAPAQADEADVAAKETEATKGIEPAAATKKSTSKSTAKPTPKSTPKAKPATGKSKAPKSARSAAPARTAAKADVTAAVEDAQAAAPTEAPAAVEAAPQAARNKGRRPARADRPQSSSTPPEAAPVKTSAAAQEPEQDAGAVEGPSADADLDRDAHPDASTGRRSRSGRRKSRSRGGRSRADQAQDDQPNPTPSSGEPGLLTAEAPSPDTAAAPEPEAPPPSPATPPVPDLRPPHSAVLLDPTGRPGLLWQPGKTCPAALDQVARDRLDDDGLLRLDDDAALPLLIRLAREAQHELRIAPDLWLQLAWHRDALHRLRALERAYPQGPASADLQQLLTVPLAPFQAEGALFAACAGRALIADEPGLGKTAQAIATIQLMRRHVGIDRVLVLCADAAVPTWHREWLRFAGVPDGASTRILGASRLDEALAAEQRAWAPDLIVIDEPQRLGAAWSAIPTRHALVLCGATDECDPALLQRIVQYLDGPRRGAAWTWDASERSSLETAMASVALQRTRDEVRAQLPALVPSARIVPMEPAQRQAHDERAARVGELLGRWRRTGLLPDLDQWQLDNDVREMQALCHRDTVDGPLREATLTALVALVDELLPPNVAPPAEVAVCCPTEADLDLVTTRLGARAGLSVVASVHDVPDEAAVLVRLGVPWRPMRGARDLALWRCIHLVAQRGLDSGLYDAMDGRRDAPRGMAEEGRGFLSGDRLQAYLLAVETALRAARAD